MIKRLFDIVCAAVGLVLCAPLLLVIAVAIRWEDGGPVLFRQERTGRRGRPFHIHKFRSMRTAPGPEVTSDGDDRITRVGRLLRASKLDELPQLYDVLLGRMSLVGPRPEVRCYVDHWPSVARWRILSVRPGITDPASIAYRNESAELARADRPEEYYVSVVLPRKVELYVRYVETRSFLGDLLILARTVQAVLGR
ncbi:sugar transferase [Micromonospora echinospora]|uniref:Sugar transferase involved in LPS biosynthesis (Colanic, teichoic acid) n=1 Tax=Micromonospora echinospora TaxID=1877 RepID=A0A1C4U7C4_MICEC|nr:sugar transferase [Micromonospora echinospora]OZV81006.1 sugar transferase [Micromonospora echinospora]SCE67564.1 Sugar transferase involved in LPS biosynthesis (colanic, teichoic acid) [Micromonospora echinospora]